jgi:hypothetical protein
MCVSYPKLANPNMNGDSAISFEVPGYDSKERIHADSLAVMSSARIGRMEVVPPLLSSSDGDFALLTPAQTEPDTLPSIQDLVQMQANLQSQLDAYQTLLAKLVSTLSPEQQAQLQRLPRPAKPVDPAKQTPVPAMLASDSAMMQQQVWERMGKLQEEPQSLWQRLLGKAK